MKMRPSGTAGSTTHTDPLSTSNVFAFLDLDFRQMHIKGEQTLTVVEHHAITLEEQWLR